jgi:hypothetical protein
MRQATYLQKGPYRRCGPSSAFHALQDLLSLFQSSLTRLLDFSASDLAANPVEAFQLQLEVLFFNLGGVLITAVYQEIRVQVKILDPSFAVSLVLSFTILARVYIILEN